MIGSVLFYALYPLSRFLTSLRSEAPKKGPPAAVNGKAVWDGGAVKTRRFTQSQTTLLDQWLSSSSGMETEKKERVKEPIPEKKCSTRPDIDNEQLIPVLQNDKTDASSKNSDVQPAEREKEAQRRNGQDRQGQENAPEKEMRTIQHQFEEYCVTQNKREESVSLTEDITPEQELYAQLKCLKMKESTPQTSSEKPSSEDPATSVQTNIQEATCQTQEQTQLPMLTEFNAPAEITEFWDDYLLPAVDEKQSGESSSALVFASPLANIQTHLKICSEHDAQTGWHFPAGLGLTEEVHCPLWQFPEVSYYPPLESTTAQFEVMWRVWEEVDESASAEATSLKPLPFTNASMEFTVMSYNILAQDLLDANQGLYTHCPLEVLDWSYRCSLLLEEILKWAPDILCLQEVQENHYQEQLLPVLSQMGYSCVYKRRTGNKTDGCATCYRSSRFSELSVTLLEFLRPDTELLDRHNVGVVLLLQPVVTKGPEIKAKGPPLCVANTHLLFNPSRGDVKLAQLAILLAEVDSVVQSCKAKGEHCNLILCGDFNALPHTPLYQLIVTGELYFQGLPAWMISGQEDLSYKVHCHRLQAPLWPSSLGITDTCQYSTVKEVFEKQHQKPGNLQFSHDFLLQLRFCPAACVRPLDMELIPGVTDNTPDATKKSLHYDKSFRQTIRHQLDLESVYKHILPGSGNPEITTLHSEGAATVDYIFYTQRRVLTADQKAGGNSVNEGLKLIGSLSLLSEDVLLSMRGLPNHIFPSDHLSLLAKFQLELNAS